MLNIEEEQERHPGTDVSGSKPPVSGMGMLRGDLLRNGDNHTDSDHPAPKCYDNSPGTLDHEMVGLRVPDSCGTDLRACDPISNRSYGVFENAVHARDESKKTVGTGFRMPEDDLLGEVTTEKYSEGKLEREATKRGTVSVVKPKGEAGRTLPEEIPGGESAAGRKLSEERHRGEPAAGRKLPEGRAEDEDSRGEKLSGEKYLEGMVGGEGEGGKRPADHPAEPRLEIRETFKTSTLERLELSGKARNVGVRRIGVLAFAMGAIAVAAVILMTFVIVPERKAASDFNGNTRIEGRGLPSSEIYKKTSPAIAIIEVTLADGNESQGSGFFIDGEGTLVTNYHVIDKAVEGYVTLSGIKKHAILGVKDCNKILDLAVLEVDCRDTPYLEISDRQVQTGESIYTLGAPLGLNDTFSDGIVSNASRKLGGVRYIQITAPISPGNSGGPLINTEGQVIGVNTFVYTEGQNLNFAVDIRELDKLEKSGTAKQTLLELDAERHPSTGT